MFDEIFANELKAALDFVNSDIDKDLYDSVDEKVKRQTVKKRRLCEKGHINEVRDNRKICDRNFCFWWGYPPKSTIIRREIFGNYPPP